MAIITTEVAIVIQCPNEDADRIRRLLHNLRSMIEDEIELGDQSREKDKEGAEVAICILKEWLYRTT